MKKIFHVIPHTHWDFEWYFSTHESLIQLIYHMDEVMTGLENGDNDSYLLDGQLSIVEDYLEQCPEQTARFTRLVEQGKLVIGPWYTQTDQLIIGGESIVRNLVTGIRLGEQFGQVMKVGYVPDSFGQSIDMPKIYRGVGIDKTVFWRGLSSDICASRELNWRCEDGSSVLAYNIKDGYFVGSYIIDNDDPTALYQQSASGSLAQNIAVPLGGDQRYIDSNVKQRIKVANNTNHEHQMVESSYQKFFDSLASEKLDLPTISGEMIDGQVSKIHRSIYSSRYDHKYLNDKIERRLSYQLEPLMVIANTLGIDAQPVLVNNIWKVIMRNHAHDSAGGCNTDKTNKIIVSRFEQADQMSGSAVDYLVRKMAESQQSQLDGRLTLFNTLPFAREQVIRINVSTASPHFVLADKAGHPINYDLLNVNKTYRGTIQKNEADNDPDLYYYQSDIAFSYALNASSLTSLQIIESVIAESTCNAVECAEQVNINDIENSHYHLVYQDGKFNLFDKKQQRSWPDCLHLNNMGDGGDTYDYSPPEHDWLLSVDWKDAQVVTQKGKQSQSLIIEGEWLLPKDLHSREQQKLDGSVSYKMTLRLDQENDAQACPLVIDIEFDNQVCDHRMQLVFSAPFASKTSWSDTPFGVVQRDNVPTRLKDWREAGWKEEPSPIYPMLHFANLHDENNSLTLFSKGGKEYEVLADNQLALTLFRSVGWLGKPDLQRRPGIASGQQFKYIATPDSQLLGQIKYECALSLNADFTPALLQRQWQQYAVDILDYQQQSLNQFTNTLKYFVMHPLASSIPDSYQGCDINSPDLVISAIKPADDGEGFILRLYNPNSEPIQQAGVITLPESVTSMVETNLQEVALERELSVSNTVDLGCFLAKQIRTFKCMTH